MKCKEDIEKMYQLFIGELNNFKVSFSRVAGGQNTQFSQIKSAFVTALEEEISVSSREMKYSIEEAVWDKLTIAFFGETNAGKSTIIETLRILYDKDKDRLTDGQIVGDGRSDFTQTYEEYNFEIDGTPLTLIDVPGIEGNEKLYTDGIVKALRRAHIVFYVHGHNIKPNVATAEKIKQYLGDWVSVYSIYNVRGSASDYDEEDERVDLYTEKLKEREELIVSTFKEELGEVYKGNITLQALLAMCVCASFSPERKDLIRKQENIRSQWKTGTPPMEFSRFSLLKDLILSKSQNYLEEIVKANEQKMRSMARRAETHLQEIVKAQQDKTDSFKKSLIRFRRDVIKSFSSTTSVISSRMRAEIDKRMYHLTEVIDKIIDDKEKDKDVRAQKAVKNEMKLLQNNLDRIPLSEIESLRATIEKEKLRLDAEYTKYITILGVNERIQCNITLNKAFKSLDISFSNCFDFATAVIGGAAFGSMFTLIAPGVATVLGAVVSSASWGLRKLIFGDGGRSKAKEKAHQAISKGKKEILDKIRPMLQEITISLNKKKEDICSVINAEQAGLSDIEATIGTASYRINQFIDKLNN
jgi:hypothetical protein